MNGKIILDAYNANPTSVSNAIESFSRIKNSKAVVLGDMFELGNNSYMNIKKLLNCYQVKILIAAILLGKIF